MAILRMSVVRGGRPEGVIVDESNNQLDAEACGVTWDTAKVTSLDNLAGLVEAIKGRIMQNSDRGSVAQSRFYANEGATMGTVALENSYDDPTFTALTAAAGVEFKAASYTTAGHLVDDINTIMQRLVTLGFPPDVAGPTVAFVTPTSAATYVTATAALSIAGTATDASGVTNVEYDVDTADSGAATGTTSWSKSGLTMTEGENVITVTAYDKYGNAGTDTLTVTLDTEDPVVEITTPASSPQATSTTPETVEGTASDNVELASVTFSVDTGDSGTCTGTETWTCSVDLVAGSNIVTITATDTAGNTATDTVTFTYTP